MRFNVYSYAMQNLFSPADFAHHYDKNNRVYLLLNQSEPEPQRIKDSLVELLSSNFGDVLFDPVSVA